MLHQQLLAAELLDEVLATRVEVHVLADVVRGDRDGLWIGLLLEQLNQHPAAQHWSIQANVINVNSREENENTKREQTSAVYRELYLVY